MSKICLISDNEDKSKKISDIVEKQGFSFLCHRSGKEDLKQLEEFSPDVILLDGVNAQNYKDLGCQLVLIANNSNELSPFADAYLTEPLDEKILLSTLTAQIKNKKALETLTQNNLELSRSLYQLNVLYNTSSQFAGTLDKGKLFQIMHEGLEKSLSFDLSCVLFFLDDNGANLVVNSLYPLTPRLEKALLLRTMLAYKNLFAKKHLPFEIIEKNVNVIKNIKTQHIEYDLEVFNYDSLFSPITVGENFFGLIEIYRKNPFSAEDVTCFNTISHQAALPLRSATLYDEIKNTNIKLQKLERLKSEFISIVSHELRTPLTAINSSLEIINNPKSGELPPVKQKFADMAKRNAKRLSGIINDLLDLSKAEAGKLDYRFEILNISSVLELVKNSLEHLAVQKNIELTLFADVDLPEVYADPQRLEQILTNLISNAVKFTPEGGKISVSAVKKDASQIDKSILISPVNLEGEYIVISVKDSGIGIKEEDISKAFDMFLQIENSLSRKVGGTGLGLSITKQLVDAHMGAVWVKSEVEVGSEFSFAIPVSGKKTIFMLDLAKIVSLTKNSSKETGIVIIKQNSGCNFINDVKESGLIKLSSGSKEYTDETLYMAYVPNAGKSMLEFAQKRLESYLYDNRDTYKNCDILFNIGLCPKDIQNVSNYIKRAMGNLSKLKIGGEYE